MSKRSLPSSDDLPEEKSEDAPPPAKRAKMDRSIIGGLYHYAVTFSFKDGVTDEQAEVLKTWHAKFEKYLLVKELCDNGNPHYHSGIACHRPSTANAITKQLCNLFKLHNWDWTPNAVKVKRMSDFWGWMHYLTKELSQGMPVLHHGWQMTWIREGLEANHIKKPTCLIMKGKRAVKKHEAVDLIIDYAATVAIPLTGKESYKCVIKRMTKLGYRFHNVRHEQAFVEVMCVMDDDSFLDTALENALQFL